MQLPQLLLVALASSASASALSCGLKIAPCPAGQTCVPQDEQCSNLNVCLGTCTPTPTPSPRKRAAAEPYPTCGVGPEGPISADCPAGSSCIQHPIPFDCGLDCDTGICIPDDTPICAGFIGLPCPDGMTCYDDGRDDCDPDAGGSDCTGICLAPLLEARVDRP